MEAFLKRAFRALGLFCPSVSLKKQKISKKILNVLYDQAEHPIIIQEI